MQGVIQNGIYTDETKLTLSYELYTAMVQDPTLYAGGPYTADFLALMQASVSEQLKDVELPRKELYELPAAVLVQVQANANSINVLMTQMAGAQAQINTGGLAPAQVVALEADIAAWQQGIDGLNTYNKTAMANIDAARAVEAQAGGVPGRRAQLVRPAQRDEREPRGRRSDAPGRGHQRPGRGVLVASAYFHSAMKMFVSPATLPPRLEQKTRYLPSGLNIGKPSKSSSRVTGTGSLPATSTM